MGTSICKGLASFGASIVAVGRSKKGEKLVGSNTDYEGAMGALKEKTHLNGKKVLVIGSGGAARAILYGLNRERASATIVNRTRKRAEMLAREFGVALGLMENISRLLKEHDIIINATSVGMLPHAKACIIRGRFPPGKIAMDIVYSPRKTQFIKKAQDSGCATVTGERMLIHQAMGQFEQWTGQEPDAKAMEKGLLGHMEDD